MDQSDQVTKSLKNFPKDIFFNLRNIFLKIYKIQHNKMVHNKNIKLNQRIITFSFRILVCQNLILKAILPYVTYSIPDSE